MIYRNKVIRSNTAWGGKKVSILIVDDSNFILQFLEHNLKSAGYKRIHSLTNGEAVFTFLRENEKYKEVDLILMDVFMGKLNGIEVCKKLKRDPFLKEIPVIIMTSNASEAILQNSFSAGAFDYIPKPIRKTELLARVSSAINLKQQMDKVKEREKELIGVKNKLELVNRELARIVSLDSLTGIPNRRAFDETIETEWKHAYEQDHHLSLIIIDIDYFKQFNDTYGHQAGDECLQLVAYEIRQSLKGSVDFAARYGGEEFAVILPNTDLTTALNVAETIRSHITKLQIPNKKATSTEGILTISLGVSAMKPRNTTENNWTKLIRYADDALYLAKDNGRNIVMSKK